MPYSHPLTETEIEQALAALPHWEVRDDRLRKVFALPSFRAAIAFVNHVAELAEAADHHPNITIAYKNVTFVLTTWAAGGKITVRDTELAGLIEELRGRDETASG